MISAEGNVLHGLDEFMLRLGHLKVVCSVAAEVHGSAQRVQKETARTLLQPSAIPSGMMREVARYLLRKKLCAVEGSAESARSGAERLRYPNLVLRGTPDALSVAARGGNAPPKVWWQDLCLAASGVRSRVGAVTADAKAGSKTGLSHVFDWAEKLDLIGAGGGPSPVGSLIARLKEWPNVEGLGNPYVLGNDVILLAHLVLERDFDVFGYMVERLSRCPPPIRKAEATQCFADAVEQLVSDSEHQRGLSGGRQRTIYALHKDLARSVPRGESNLADTSTAWHRTASRMEMYVDFGLLEKGLKGPDELYEYVYYPTPALERARQTLNEAGSGRDWLERHLVPTLFEGAVANELSASDLIASVLPIVTAVGRPTALLPIDTVALGTCWLQADKGQPVTVGAVRAAIERLARTDAAAARLARGNYSDRAEFVSFDLRELRARA